MKLRVAAAADSAALLAIYGQYIETTITFEYVLPDVREFAGRITGTLAEYPYLVCEEDGRILGYAYAHRAQARAAYQWNAELSVYLDRSCTGRGLGRMLYRALIDLLRMQGVKTVYGCVTHPNRPSEALHARLGFAPLGTFHKAGYKCGAWHDVTWFEKEIAPHADAPTPPVPFPALPQAQVEDVLARCARPYGKEEKLLSLIEE
ncbi:MAG: N-acetyltransferase [Butyricicoccus sp.]|nr:N-acetyltransferase [Butyricicoccus sp.]